MNKNRDNPFKNPTPGGNFPSKTAQNPKDIRKETNEFEEKDTEEVVKKDAAKEISKDDVVFENPE